MTRSVEFVFHVTRNDADYAVLHPISGSSPTLFLDESKAIRMSMQGQFVDPGPDVNFLTDRIRPEIIIDGIAYPLGILLPAKVETIITETGHHLSIQAYDQCWLLQTTSTETTTAYSADTKYLTAIDELLDAAGIGATLTADNNYTFSRTRADWLAGTNYLSIINDLLSEMDYSRLWFNQDGYAVLFPEPDPQNGPIAHTLDETDVRSLLIPTGSIGTDYFSMPNVFFYMCSNIDSSLMTATAINNDIGSPISVPRRGRKIYSINNVKDVPSQDVLQSIANRAMERSLLRTDTIRISTGILPNFGLNDLVALNINGELSVCIERGWTMQMAPGGTMNHRLERVSANYE